MWRRSDIQATRETGSGSGKLLDDGFGQLLVDLVVPWDRLGLPRDGVRVPIVAPAMAYQIATHVFKGLD